MPNRFRLGRLDGMMPCIMLVLLALPSLGLTMSTSRSLFGKERPVETEEVEERVACSSQRRERASRPLQRVLAAVLSTPARWSTLRAIARPMPIDGHRIANGLLAPMRC
ncbi:hypothetical protein [Rosistilla ulvae]|nr:hypothetical protein [Rosistilla ulvae]